MSATPIDLSRLPVPDFVEAIDYETLLAERKARLVSFYPADEQAEVAETLKLESEPMTKLLQENTYREIVLRQRVQDVGRSLLLAYADGSTLEHLAVLFDIERLTIVPGDPDNGIEPVYEEDDDLRTRTQLAPRGFSVAGPGDAYVLHARNADGRVLSASVVSPAPCEILVTILSREGDGTASDELIGIVRKALQADGRRPLTDKVTVQSARIVHYQIRATLKFFSGPDRAVVLTEARKRAQKYAADMHRLGMEVTVDGLHAAIRVAGVQKVILDTPLESIPVTKQQATWCTGIELIDGGVYGE
jgi:phage-related baseplate assembly protein